MTVGIPPYIFDHVDRAVSSIVSYLRQPRFTALVEALGEEVQCLEDALWAAIAERRLSVAVGANLDQWGDLVGELRRGLTDGEFRAFIEARIRTNVSEGTLDELTAILAIIGRAVQPVQYSPIYPAGLFLEYVTEQPASAAAAARIVAQMEEAAPSGVAVYRVVEGVPGYFGFAGNNNALGFGEGQWAHKL